MKLPLPFLAQRCRSLPLQSASSQRCYLLLHAPARRDGKKLRVDSTLDDCYKLGTTIGYGGAGRMLVGCV